MYYQVKRWRTSLNSSAVDGGDKSTPLRAPPTRGRSSSTAYTLQAADKRASRSANKVKYQHNFLIQLVSLFSLFSDFSVLDLFSQGKGEDNVFLKVEKILNN